MKRICAFVILLAIMVFSFTGCNGIKEMKIIDNDNSIDLKQLKLPEYDPEYTFVTSFDGKYIVFSVTRPVSEDRPGGVGLETESIIVYDAETETVITQWDIGLYRCSVTDAEYKDGCIYYVVSSREEGYETLYCYDGVNITGLHTVPYNALDTMGIDVMKDKDKNVVFVSRHTKPSENGEMEILQLGYIDGKSSEVTFSETGHTTSKIFNFNTYDGINGGNRRREYTFMQYSPVNGTIIQKMEAFNPDSNNNGVSIHAQIPMKTDEFCYVVGNNAFYYDYTDEDVIFGPMSLNVYNIVDKSSVKLAEYEAMKRGDSRYGTETFVYWNYEGGNFYVLKSTDDGLERSCIENRFFDKKSTVRVGKDKILFTVGQFREQPDELYIAEIK